MVAWASLAYSDGMSKDVPRLQREDLRVMDAYDGEHYPVEVDVTIWERIGEVMTQTGSDRVLRCGCTDSLELAWDHR